MEVLEHYIPDGVSEIVSGGAAGIDSCASQYARTHGLALKVFRPDYDTYGRSAPIRRNIEIIDYADIIFIFWDGHSAGSKFVIDRARQTGKLYQVFALRESNSDS